MSFAGSAVASPMTPSDSQVLGFDLVVGPQLVRTRGIDHPAFTHHVHVMDQLQRERGVLFDQQNRMAFLLQPRDRLPQPLDDDGREPLGRLVHDQAIRIRHQPTADGQHLLLSARERSGALAASFAQAREQRIDPFHVPAATVDAALGDHEVLLDAERGKDAPALRHEAHPAAHRLERRNLGNIRPLEQNLSAAWTIETHDRVHQRGLADAVASEQPEDLSFLELQGQALEDISVPVIGVNVLNFQDRHGSGGPEIDLLHFLAAADLLRRSRLQYLAEMEDGNMLGDVEYDVHIVLDEEDGEVAIEVGEKSYHFRGLARGEAGGRFIQEQDLRVAGEAEDDFELSLLAVRQVANLGVFAVQEPGAFQEPVSPVVEIAIGGEEPPHYELRPPQTLDRQQHVVENGELREQAGDLKRSRHSERRASMARPPGHVSAEQHDVPGGGREDSRDQIEQSGLAGAVRSDDGLAVTGHDLERDVAHGAQAAEALRERPELENRLAAVRVRVGAHLDFLADRE